VGKDAAAGKATFVGLLGVKGARREARRLVQSAAGRLARFGDRATQLAQVAAFVVERKH
jgi:farnesyl diphosphate synthase